MLRLRNRRGSALLAVVMLLLGVAAASMAIFHYHVFTTRSLLARTALYRADLAADGALNVMVERLVGLSEQRLGLVTQSELDSLTAGLSSYNAGDGVELDASQSGFEIVDVRTGDRVPLDAVPLRVIPDQARARFGLTPPVAGALSAQTVEVEVRATVRTTLHGRRTATTRVAVSKVPPHREALLGGDLEVCVSPGSDGAINGPVRAFGRMLSVCDGARAYSGGIQARNEIVVSGAGAHLVAWEGGSAPLTSILRSDVESSTSSTLGAWGGRVRLDDALGGIVHAGPFQDARIAGTGECLDFSAGCSGNGSFFPSAEVQHQAQGPDASFDLRCGYAYNGASCDGIRAAISYTPFPFTSEGMANGVAAPDPSDGNRLWQGLFPEFRRDKRVTANLGPHTFRTFRSTSNPYGFVIDVSALPAIPGGLLSIRRWSAPTAGANPSGYQEVVVLVNARTLQGPLTIHSELPVYVAGPYNDLSRLPSLIDAPLITAVPTDILAQAQTAMVWDSVGAPANLIARSSAEIVSVLRSNYHLSPAGAYYGGTFEQIPSVLGDWSHVTLTVTGAVEGRQVDPSSSGAYAQWFRPYGSPQTEMQVRQPRTRILNHDERLLGAAFYPPGSWSSLNIPASGAGGTRTRERQLNAIGGFTVVRQTQPVRRGVTD